MSKSKESLFLFLCTIAVIIISYWLGQQAYSWMPISATKEARHVDELFSFLVTLGSVVFLGVTGMFAYAVVVWRADPNDYSEGHATRGDWRLEILWTGIPTILVLWIAVQSWNVYQELGLEVVHDKKADLFVPNTEIADQSIKAEYVVDKQVQSVLKIPEVKVIAKQWEWSFHYLKADFISDELHLPLNKKTRFIFESEDVIHGFFIPEFRFKQDIIPNRTVEITFTPLEKGKYILHDSQFSGTYFALMEADVYVESQADYDNWLKTANGNPSIKPNLAVEEYERSRLDAVAHGGNPQDRAASLHTAFKSNWDTVKPATSMPVVASSVGD